MTKKKGKNWVKNSNKVLKTIVKVRMIVYNLNEVMKMKKMFVLTMAIFAMLFATASYATGVVIDSERVAFNESAGTPFVDGGRTLVPLRATMEAFGAEVSWDDATKTAFVTYGSVTVKCTAWEKMIYRNGVKIENDAAACIVDGRTYLPIRAVLEAFGATVGWNGTDVTVATEYGEFVRKMETGGSKDGAIWQKWNNAVALQESGSYSAAASAYEALAPNFVYLGDVNSAAMMYLRLGNCLTAMGDYKNAAFSYKREAYYWNKANLHEEEIDATRRSGLIKSDITVYAETDDKDKIKMADMAKDKNGIVLGAYAELDDAIYSPTDPSRFYMDTFPIMTGKEHGAYLLYLPYGTDISHYSSHVERAKEHGYTVQIALEPHNGMASVTDEAYLIRLAENMENSGCSFILRFAGEMNDTTCKWYTADTEIYKQKFRLVADVFHRYAPSVPVVWSPNFYPEDTMELYYPGDEYVDYVGISAYKVHQVETDPLKLGVDRSAYSDVMERLVRLYGDRKPIIVSEGAASYMDYDTMGDITPFAVKQLKEFYAYLPIRYPQVKMVFYFDADRERWKFSLSDNAQVLEAYKQAISAEVYTESLSEGERSFYIETADNVSLKAKKTSFASYINHPYRDDISYTVYFINGAEAAVAYGIPYTVDIDLSPYAGQKIELTVKAFGINGPMAEKTVRLSIN